MKHGYAGDGLEGLKEYLGEPDEIVRFVGDAEILVTHLAPINGAILDRLPGLKLIAVSRGGPVNIDIEACRQGGFLGASGASGATTSGTTGGTSGTGTDTGSDTGTTTSN